MGLLDLSPCLELLGKLRRVVTSARDLGIDVDRIIISDRDSIAGFLDLPEITYTRDTGYRVLGCRLLIGGPASMVIGPEVVFVIDYDPTVGDLMSKIRYAEDLISTAVRELEGGSLR
jgi:hypothetical protein